MSKKLQTIFITVTFAACAYPKPVLPFLVTVTCSTQFVGNVREQFLDSKAPNTEFERYQQACWHSVLFGMDTAQSLSPGIPSVAS